MNYEPHPLAELIPAASDEEYAALKAHIKAHGLLFPIVLHEGMVLDGRHRLRACQELGMGGKFVEFDGPNPAAFVIGANLERRHLSESQKAMVAARFAKATVGQPKKNTAHGRNTSTVAKAAEAVGASPRSTERAKVVIANAVQEVIDLVDANKATVRDAEAVAKKGKTIQREAVKRFNAHTHKTLKVAANAVEKEKAEAKAREAAEKEKAEIDAKANLELSDEEKVAREEMREELKRDGPASKRFSAVLTAMTFATLNYDFDGDGRQIGLEAPNMVMYQADEALEKATRMSDFLTAFKEGLSERIQQHRTEHSD